MKSKNQKIIIRQISADDIGSLMQIEKAAWGATAAAKEMLLSRISVFPEGIFCAVKDGVIQGFAANQIIDSKNLSSTNLSWATITDNGYIKKSHDHNGDSLYGVSISVPPYVSDKNVALKLYEYGGKLVIRHNLKKVYLGSRIPSYHKYADKMSVEGYVYGKSSTGRVLDPELALYLKLGMKIEKIMPNYFIDPESLNYAVLVSWENPFYRLTKYSKILAKLLAGIYWIFIKVK